MKLTARGALLLSPAILVYGTLLVLPLVFILDESFRQFIPGRVGSVEGAPRTLQNYTVLQDVAYVGFFWTTFKLATSIALLSVLIAYPIAYFIVRHKSGAVRRGFIGFLIIMMFLSALVRVYSIELTLGSAGIIAPYLRFLGVNMNSRAYVEWTVVVGMLHFVIPMAVLTLLGTLQNINPRLVEAAQGLGAPRWRSHVTITIPLSVTGVMSAFLISFTIGSSAFVVPWILGKGRVLFVSNLVYSRFSEVANYPSGSAISIVMLLVSLAVVSLAIRLGGADRAGRSRP